MNHLAHDIGVAKHIGRYSDAIEVAPSQRWLFTSGTPGIGDDGNLPCEIVAQTRIVWRHITLILGLAGMTVRDLVKVSTTLINPADRAEYVRVRSEFLGEVRPAFMLSIVREMIRPDVLVEVEVVAAAPQRVLL